MNCLEKELREDLKEALDSFRDDKDSQVAVLTGQGRAFCAGGSLNELKNGMDSASGVGFMSEHNDLILLITSITKPIIASVNGAAVGAGFSLALACDMIIASNNAMFLPAFVKLGLIPDMGISYFLPRIVGIHRAKELIFTSKMIKSEEAQQMGLVNQIVDPGELETCALNLAIKIAAGPALAIALGKVILSRSLESSLQDILKLEGLAQSICFQSHDHKEAVEAFYLKRNPELGFK
jgi:2-(1,2-epoxy-1,2-dihydrophenyl)acetyl-CoA isomerase